ncbi:MAG: hypothetical protein KIT43_06600 [Bauldia sp.]|nr:hypothetical protein [Bauldia sp.]MCW5717290.1 hypothetical protein [Bauldia sp.]
MISQSADRRNVMAVSGHSGVLVAGMPDDIKPPPDRRPVRHFGATMRAAVTSPRRRAFSPAGRRRVRLVADLRHIAMLAEVA